MSQRVKRKRRGRSGFLLTLFVIIALIFSFVLTGGLFFKIKDIRVEGLTVTNQQEIVSLTGFNYGDNIFFINKMAAVRAILAKNPYVTAVRIKRDLPGTVILIITESAPAAMVEHRGRVWLFDAQGKLLESALPVQTTNVPLVKGISLLDPMAGTKLYPVFEDTAKLDPLLHLLQTMQTEGIWEDVREIDITLLSNLRFTYMDQYTVELGMPDALDEKFRTMLESLKKEEIRGWPSGTFLLADVAEGKNGRFIPGP
jgi:cell division protein FtsQ